MKRPISLAGRRAILAGLFLLTGCGWGQNSAADYTIGIIGSSPSLEQALGEAGYPIQQISYQDVADGSVTVHQISCLVFVSSERFPYSGRNCLMQFLRDGGDLITMGGYAFKTPVYAHRGKLYSQNELLRTLVEDATDRHIVIDFSQADLSGWSRDCDNIKSPSTLSKVNKEGFECAQMDIRNFSRWDTFRGPFVSQPGQNALTLRIKGSDNLRKVVVEIRESDGSRWVAAADLSTQWQDIVILQTDFQFLPDGSPSGRGKSGDILSLDRAAYLQMGMSYDYSAHKIGDYQIWIQQAGTARVQTPEGFGLPLFDKMLPIFSDQPYHRFAGTSRLCVCPDQSFVSELPTKTLSVSGVSAIGFPYIDQSQYFGIVEVLDDFDRLRGFAAGILVHYNGPYKEGRWLLFGVENEEFYSTELFTQTVLRSLKKMQDRSLSASLAEAAAQARKKFMPRPKSSLRSLRLSPDGRHLQDSDGKPFFMLGVNYIGSFDCKTSHASKDFVFDKWETDFRKARRAGINCMRLWIEEMNADKKKMDSILYLADKYGIYLLLHPTAHPKEKGQDLADLFSSLAQLASGEPAIIGYDLMNEPYITTLGSVRIDGRASDILSHGPYSRYAEKDFYDKEWVDMTAKIRTGWPPLGDWISRQEAKDLLAAYSAVLRYSGRFIAAKDYSCLFGIDGALPVDPVYAEFFMSVDHTISDWIRVQKQAIRSQDPDGLVTVGYNTALALMPANESLDFVSHHLYQPPSSFVDMQKAVTTFDRLHSRWPEKPITLGEFGYSCGTQLPDGSILDIHNSAVGEMILYLYALANGFDGAMSWMVSDWPVALMDYSAPWIGKSRQAYEAGFGLYAYDGTLEGRAKPVVYAMRFLRDYLDTLPSGPGVFRLVNADTQTGAGYIYENEGAFFVGMKTFQNDNISLNASAASNLMLCRIGKELRILSTADAVVSLKQTYLENILGPGEFRAEGVKKSFRRISGEYILELLEGQTCTIIKNAMEKKNEIDTVQK